MAFYALVCLPGVFGHAASNFDVLPLEALQEAKAAQADDADYTWISLIYR